MHIAIVGGTGSIGMATAARLAARGHHPIVMSRRAPAETPEGVRWCACDVADLPSVRDALAAHGAERVVHLAALLQFACNRDPEQAIRVNVDGTLNVLKVCRDLAIRRVVFGSSIAVYGERSDVMRETDGCPAATNLYAETKRLGEVLGGRCRDSWGIEFVALRYSGVFGPGEPASAGMALVRHRILQCASGDDVPIEGASGDERAHLTYVDDAAEATCAALLGQTPAHLAYNVAGPAVNHISLRDLHAMVRQIAPNSGRALWSGRGPSVGRVDTARISEELGWRPRITLEEGLDRLLSASSPEMSHGVAGAMS